MGTIELEFENKFENSIHLTSRELQAFDLEQSGQ